MIRGVPCAQRAVQCAVTAVRAHSNITAACVRRSVPVVWMGVGGAGKKTGYPAASPKHEETHLTTLSKSTTLSQQLSAMSLRSDLNQPREYRLPTLIQNSTLKKTILDPLTNPTSYDLPAHLVGLVEKVVPPTGRNIIIQDPGLLPGGATREIETMPYLINIRRKKMKKHKLKKFRKRMIFVHRRLTEIKKKKKEQKMLAMERRFSQIASDFDADQHIENHIELAKKGGWKLDILAERYKKKSRS